MVGLGDTVAAGDPLCILHAADEDSAEIAAQAVRTAITIGEGKASGPLIIERVE